MGLKVTVLNPVANIRRGPTTAASRFSEAKGGEQFDVVQLIDLQAPEQWAKIAYPGHMDGDFYICVTMPNGNKVCQVGMAPAPISGDYQRGWNDCLDAVHADLVVLRK